MFTLYRRSNGIWYVTCTLDSRKIVKSTTHTLQKHACAILLDSQRVIGYFSGREISANNVSWRRWKMIKRSDK